MGLVLSLSDTLGYDTAAVADLLPDAEAGLLEGLARLRKEETSP
jgi:hypothetical protein